MFTKVGHMLGHKTNLNFQKYDILQNTFFRKKMELN